MQMAITDPTALPADDVACKHVMHTAALALIAEIMPEAITAGKWREEGLKWETIAERLDIARPTLHDQLAQLRQIVELLYPNLFD